MRYIIGIDEVGRGPLAGPVTVCAVLCEENLYKKLKKDRNLPPPGKDSKKLSPELRQKYSNYLKHIGVPYVIVHISNKQIDKIGIAKCIKKAIEKGIKKIVNRKTPTLRSGSQPEASALKILLDGGLKIPVEFVNKYPEIKFTQSTIIKGDEKEKIIAWASILAKVSRDNLMVKMHKKYPAYSFHNHKGYGTKSHTKVILKKGLSVIHRKTFCKRFT